MQCLCYPLICFLLFYYLELEVHIVNIKFLNSGAPVKAYHDHLVAFLCSGSQRKFLRKCGEHVKNGDYIVFVKSKLKEEKITLLFRVSDMYIKGFLLENRNCFLFDHAMIKLVSF